MPVLFFFNGTHEDYHGRDDEVDRIDAEKAARISQLIFILETSSPTGSSVPDGTPKVGARS